MTACIASYSVFLALSHYWLKLWTDNPDHGTLFYIVGYFLISLVAFISTNGNMWSNSIFIAVKSGVQLHSKLLNSVTRLDTFSQISYLG